ncbi:MobA/MobL family protein [Ciceribacter sp. RN22]|uniref:MobA/MobL family protein n=1 Tax=Ciceribacter sp. RN22 TaxID=2954932 RepID=UPI0020930C33|nr:MobA/MobL family protein [Ciceribacter sp. RN22]MCO6180787.1 MobA/MobL family protein [Ciceribacter sp. RN22]
MVRETMRDLAKRYGAVDFAVHVPREENDVHNGHAHVMMTTGQVTESGHGAVTISNKKTSGCWLSSADDRHAAPRLASVLGAYRRER